MSCTDCPWHDNVMIDGSFDQALSALRRIAPVARRRPRRSLQPSSNPIPSKFHARNHRRQRPHPPVDARGRAPRGRAHALRRAVVARSCSARSPGATSCSSPATATATRFRRTASTTARTCGRSRTRGATAVVAVASVGGIRGAQPGDLVLPHQLIDYTHGPRSHVLRRRRAAASCTSTSPIRTRRTLRDALPRGGARRPGIAAASMAASTARSTGPRLETAAEIDRMERDGATLVGMTGMPEAALARELALPYAAICVVVNHAAGRGDSAQQVSMEGISPGAGERRWTRCARCSTTSRRSAMPGRERHDPRRPAHGRSAPARSARREVERFGTPRARRAARRHARHDGGARTAPGLAAPQIGVPLRVVIFGVEHNPRYPDAEPVPYTELVNPGADAARRRRWRRAGKAACRCPGLRGVVPRYTRLRYEGFDPQGNRDRARGRRLPRARRAARVRPSRRHPLSDAHARHAQLRLHGHPVPRTLDGDAAERLAGCAGVAQTRSCS